jgi:3-hydroxyacyl-[acyl-carrier-protein] dehydratase
MTEDVKRPAERMDIHQIKRYLPHRYPFLLVDWVDAVVPGDHLLGLKNVSVNEPYFQGHFPQRAVMPGVLVVEALAQACGLLAFKTRETQPDQPQPSGNELFYLVGVDRAKFKRPVEPGEQLWLGVQLTRTVRGIWMFEGEGRVGGEIAGSCDIRCTMRDIEP